MIEDDPEEGLARLFGFYVGVVVNRGDPEQLGRVRVRVPGLLEPESGWARPLGTGWGGSRNRGIFGVPEIGAEVGLFFDGGDPEKPFYIAANLGKPDGVSEAPPQAQRDDPDNVVMATASWRIELDESEGAEILRLTNVVNGDAITIDGPKNSIQIKATTRLLLLADGEVTIDAAAITIGGRGVEMGIDRPI